MANTTGSDTIDVGVTAWGQSPRVGTSDITSKSVKNYHIDSLTADKITTGTLTAVATLGGGTNTTGGFIRIDGENNQIIINDGTNDRIIIGFQLNGF